MATPYFSLVLIRSSISSRIGLSVSQSAVCMYSGSLRFDHGQSQPGCGTHRFANPLARWLAQEESPINPGSSVSTHHTPGAGPDALPQRQMTPAAGRPSIFVSYPTAIPTLIDLFCSAPARQEIEPPAHIIFPYLRMRCGLVAPPPNKALLDPPTIPPPGSSVRVVSRARLCLFVPLTRRRRPPAASSRATPA